MKLDFNAIENQTSKRNFEKLQREFDINPVLGGEWKLFTASNMTGVSKVITIYHGLGFIPSDIIFTKQIGTFTFDYTKFTETSLVATIGANSEVRILVGRVKT